MKGDLEKALILIGDILKDESETLDNFDSKTLRDLSQLLLLELEARENRSVQ
jgi:hypothetical protein